MTKPHPNSPEAVLFANGMWLAEDPANGNITLFSATGVRVFSINSSGRLAVQNSNTQAGVSSGLSIPGIVATSVQNQTNLAPTTLSFTPPAVAGTYRITSWLDVSTATAITFKNVLGYTDAAGNAKTDIPVWELENSATLVVNPTANTADRFVQGPYMFSIDNSGTAITLGDNTGTYTTCVYRYTIVLEQLI